MLSSSWARHRVRAAKVGDGTGELEHPVEAPGREVQLISPMPFEPSAHKSLRRMPVEPLVVALDDPSPLRFV